MLVGEIDRLGIAILVDIVVDDVPDTPHLAESRSRFFLVKGHDRPDAGAGEKSLGSLGVVRREIGTVHDAIGAHRAAEEKRRVSIARAELEYPLGSDGFGQERELAAHQWTDDRKAALFGELFHLAAHGITVVVEAPQILLDLRVDDVGHGSTSS